MGKYMRKSKASGEVAVMEVAGALLGVRTRSRTLAAQQHRPSSPSPSPSPSQQPQRKGQEDGDYLELRSRRLEKQPPPGPKEKGDAPQPAARRAAAAGGRGMESFAAEGFEADLEVSFGDNVLDWDATDRGARETTPCSLIYSSETMSTPGSATGARNHSRRRAQTPVCRYVPSSLEMDEFFAAAEQQQHQTFREKYNFCPASERPLPGRYEWTVLDC
ncbi:cyclin-dependent kinase inhibitor 5 [Aegilops tauschii subsp. strangulata]|nr:cyclin-dependent kinase inhibitor 5 [Aegilops tauschii subsp. strangulata]